MGESPQFDRYAHDYENLHRESVRASGEEPRFFAQSKVAYIAGFLAHRRREPRSVLDFGCGIGGTLGFLAEAFPGAGLNGADVSEESLRLAAETHPRAQLHPIQGGKLPMEDDSMDLAIAACVFHHIPVVERAQWARELRRVLKPGGDLFVFEHNPANPLTRKVVRDCPFDEDAILLPVGETGRLLSDAGFTGTRHDYMTFFPHALGFLRPLERFIGWCPLGAQYVAHGRA